MCDFEGTNPTALSKDIRGYSQIVSRAERTLAGSRVGSVRGKRHIYIGKNDSNKKATLPFAYVALYNGEATSEASQKARILFY